VLSAGARSEPEKGVRMDTEFTRYSEYRGHQVLSIPGDLFDRSPRFVALAHFVEPVPCGSYRSPLGAMAEVDRCLQGDRQCSHALAEHARLAAILPPRAREALVR
jgi:hypothetical protein